jgi:glycosyltransferase involved in cell wall biosynthesis
MKKIFVDAHVFDGEFQGTRTYIKELYCSFLANYSDFEVYFGAENVDILKQEFSCFDNAFYIQYPQCSSIKRIFYIIPKIIKVYSFDFAHFQYVIPMLKLSGCKYIVTIHDILFNDFKNEFPFLYRLKRNLLFKLSAKRCDHLLTVSQYSKMRISNSYKLPPELITVTPNGISSDFIDFGFVKDESRKLIHQKYNLEKVVLFVSRIEPRKNQILLIDWFNKSKLNREGYQLVFIGKETLPTDFKNKATVSANVHWLSQVAYEDLLHFYNSAELFVYPPKAEGFGIPPLEAASMLTQVVSSNETAMGEFDFFNPFMFASSVTTDELEVLINKALSVQNVEHLRKIKDEIKIRYGWSVSASILFDLISENNP